MRKENKPMSEHCHHNPKIEIIEKTEHGDIFRLLKSLPFNFKGKKFTVPKGFLSDGMSFYGRLYRRELTLERFAARLRTIISTGSNRTTGRGKTRIRCCTRLSVQTG